MQIGSDEYVGTNGGVPQGSILGPILWNVLYESGFALEQTTDVIYVEYSGDPIKPHPSNQYQYLYAWASRHLGYGALAITGTGEIWGHIVRKMKERTHYFHAGKI